MGASGWDYIAPYRVDVATSLRDLQERLYRAGDYYFPREGEEGDYIRGDSLEELWGQDTEYVECCGTHTIIDIRRGVVARTEPPSWNNAADYFTVRPLAPAKVLEYFGTECPSRAAFEELWNAQDRRWRESFKIPPNQRVHERLLAEESQMSWTGLYVLLYEGEDEQPGHVAFWGSSGD